MKYAFSCRGMEQEILQLLLRTGGNLDLGEPVRGGGLFENLSRLIHERIHPLPPVACRLFLCDQISKILTFMHLFY